MRILSLQLRNYRVYQELDIELPGGVVGVYGSNGSGKSSLLESIMWVLFGKARTQKQQLPTTGSQGECSVTLTFEHEGHLYTVRRSISGQAFTVKARVSLGEQVAADGPTDVDRYMQSVLGMDATAFRASVFAEQKQLAAFSDQAPDKRRQMVLQLLGITPVEKARDRARGEARELQNQLDKAAPMLATVADAEAKVVATQGAVAHAKEAELVTTQALVTSVVRFKQSRGAVDSLQDSKTADALIRERGNASRKRRDELTTQLATAQAELAQGEEQAVQLATLQDAIVGFDVDEIHEQIRLIRVVLAAQERLGSVVVPPLVEAPTGEELDDARDQRESLNLELATLGGQLAGARERVELATRAVNETSGLDGADGCPLCGQELGTSVEQMRLHRRNEHAEAVAAVEKLTQQVAKKQPDAQQRAKRVADLERLATHARDALAKHAKVTAERAAQQTVIAEATANLGGVTPDRPTLERLTESLAATQIASKQLAAVQTRLERLPAVRAEHQRVTDLLSQAEAERTSLLGELRSLNFDAGKFAELIQIATEAERAVEVARTTANVAAREVATAQALAQAASEQLEQVQGQHALLAEQRNRAAVLLRAGSLLHDFRQYIVGLVGPQLQIQASSLFNELTGNEYDGLEVDAETYELRVIDHGTAHPMARFSGSEVDLANLALRVAISEQVRFQAGGQVGLLVLDEALASLDAERKDRTLAALAQLGGRFQQILVVTHSPEVKEQLPAAIEVRRTGARRSTAHVVDSM
jgi:DNA repair protein SbcC/Rad50